MLCSSYLPTIDLHIYYFHLPSSISKKYKFVLLIIYHRKNMDEEGKRLKMAVISGAAHALRFKDNNPRASEQEILQYVTSRASEILEKIDDEI